MAGLNPTVSEELLPRVLPATMDDEQRALHDRLVAGPRGSGPFPIVEPDGSLNGPFGLMLQAPSVGGALAGLGDAIRYGSSLDARTREIAILTVGSVTGSRYECWAHERVAAAIGMPEAEVRALVAGNDWAEASSADLAVRDVAARMAEGGDVPSALARRLVDEIGAVAAVEVMTLAGYYVMLARMMGAFGIEPPT